MQKEQRKSIDPAKKYLWGYRAIVQRIEALRRERERAEKAVDRLDIAYDRAYRATSRMTATRVSGTGQHDGMANAVLDIIRWRDVAKQGGERANAITRRLDREILAAADALAARLALIDQLSDERYKTVMVMRYVEGLEWNAIIQRCKMPDDAVDRRERTVFAYHGKALEEIRRLMQNCSSLQ